ncbi:MAG: gamma-glutamylcyclotransferase family protein [Salinibacter sp.]
MLYFGYGSNMLTARLRARVPSATPRSTGHVDGYRLRFHKRSQDGSGKCNIVPADDAAVYGVVFDVDAGELDALDEAEQRGRGYERCDVHVRGTSASVKAFAYTAQPAYIDDALLPYEWYHALVLAGAREHKLPAPYTARLESIRSYPDPNEARRRKYRALLDDAGFPLLSS